MNGGDDPGSEGTGGGRLKGEPKVEVWLSSLERFFAVSLALAMAFGFTKPFEAEVATLLPTLGLERSEVRRRPPVVPAAAVRRYGLEAQRSIVTILGALREALQTAM